MDIPGCKPEANATFTRRQAAAGIIGNAPDVDIIPDCKRFAQVPVDDGPLVLSIFQSARTLLAANLTLEQMRATLTREVAHLSGLEAVLQAERAAAERGAQAAKADRVMAGYSPATSNAWPSARGNWRAGRPGGSTSLA